VSEASDNYLRDLGQLVKQRALEAQREKDAAAGSGRYDYELGRLMALHEVVSLMQQQAEAFGLDLAALALDDISPERDLT
jgi:hypothetical protein